MPCTMLWLRGCPQLKPLHTRYGIMFNTTMLDVLVLNGFTTYKAIVISETRVTDRLYVEVGVLGLLQRPPLSWTLAVKGLHDRLATVLDKPTGDGWDGMKNFAMEIENDVTLERHMMGCSKYHEEIKWKDHGRQDVTSGLCSRGERPLPSSRI